MTHTPRVRASHRVAALKRRLQLIAALLPAHEAPGASLQALREFLARNYVSCEQLCELLQAAPGSLARTEVFVKAFARVVDWHNLVLVVLGFTLYTSYMCV